MECYFLNIPADNRGTPIRSNRQKMYHIWKEKVCSESSKQNFCNHARAIMKNEWLSAVEIKVIKRGVLEISIDESATK